MAMSSNSTSSTPTLPDANKTDETPRPPPLDGLQLHPEFWIGDGNLILVATDVAFRVYRGLLAKQSTVFADMMAASAKDAHQSFDGCPIVFLSESSQDWAHLLRILLPVSERRLNPKDEHDHTPDELSALARLSHKYQIPDVEKQALDLLRERYPDQLAKWDRSAWRVRGNRSSILPSHCIGVVNTARLTNTPSLLPAALYACCTLGAALMEGWTREDGRVEHLSPDDFKRCFIAQERLCKEMFSLMREVFDHRSTSCPSTQCHAGLKDIAMEAMTPPDVTPCDALDILGRSGTDAAPFTTRKIRSQCKELVVSRGVKARRRLWDRLPEILGISVPGWGETKPAVSA